MASLVVLFHSCMDNLKSILTSQDFGTEYEILCSELSVQWLRVRLWGQSVGEVVFT
jgi:protein STE50